jgi:hypothetical protein
MELIGDYQLPTYTNLILQGVAPSVDEENTGRADVKFAILLYVEHRYV